MDNQGFQLSTISVKEGALDTSIQKNHSTNLVVDTHLERGSSHEIPEPEDEIVKKNSTTYFETLTHLFRGNIGSGIYAMGDAFKNAGLVFGCVFTAFLALISVHCQHILITCTKEMQRRCETDTIPDFATTVELCFLTGPKKLRSWATPMRRIVNTFLCITQLGFCCVYFVFTSTNFKKLLDHFDIIIDLRLYMGMVLVPILMSCLVRKLKYLAPISCFANFLMATGIFITLYFIVVDLPSLEERRYIADFQRIPLYFGTAIYAFEGIGLVLPLRNEMKKPDDFQKTFGVLNVGMVFISGMLITVGALGYIKWGEEVQGSLTLNLPSDNFLSLVVQGILATAITLTFPIQFYVAMEIIWPMVKAKYPNVKSPQYMEQGLRVLLVLLTFILAEAIPKLGLFISLVGAASSTTLALLIPPVIELVSRSQDKNGIPKIVIAKDVFIFLLGTVGFVTGTYESIYAIVKEFLM